MTPILGGFLLLFIAAGVVILLVAAPRSQPGGYSGRLREWGRTASLRADDAVHKSGAGLAGRIELAGVRMSAGAFVLLAASAIAGSAVLGMLVALARPSLVSFLLPVALPILAALAVRLLLDHRIETRRKAFA